MASRGMCTHRPTCNKTNAGACRGGARGWQPRKSSEGGGGLIRKGNMLIFKYVFKSNKVFISCFICVHVFKISPFLMFFSTKPNTCVFGGYNQDLCTPLNECHGIALECREIGKAEKEGNEEENVTQDEIQNKRKYTSLSRISH